MARTIVGTVVSDKSNKTIVISVAERKTHPLYKKQYTINTKFMAHDQNNEAKTGDRVIVSESRPLSKRKHFSLLRIIERGGVRFEESDATADVSNEEPPEPTNQPISPAKAKRVRAKKESK